MCYTSGVPGVRVSAAQKLDLWLNNPKYLKIAQDLMLCICYNCNEYSQADVDTMSALVRIRLKSKAFTASFTTAIQFVEFYLFKDISLSFSSIEYWFNNIQKI